MYRLIDDMRNDLEHDTTKGKTTGNRLREARRMARMLDALAALSQSCATFLDAGVGLVAIVIGPSPVSPRELYLVHFQLPQGNRDNEQELTMKHKDAIHKNVVRAIIQQSGEICGRECQKSRLHILFRAPISAVSCKSCWASKRLTTPFLTGKPPGLYFEKRLLTRKTKTSTQLDACKYITYACSPLGLTRTPSDSFIFQVHLIDVLQKSAPETTRLTNVAQLEDKYPNDAYTWQLWKKQIIGL
mmetsp:Transcript_40369/g.65041  ORF Transcript_40369/g.65041 Transcript_40369/m.65041 type:complete len:244 (-) Transcript_40369:624-1355(-)